MAVMRVQKSKNYTVMANYHLKDKELSLKAKGLLSYMLMLPDDWDYTLEGLVKSFKEGRTAVLTALKELKQTGYLRITQQRDKAGRISYIYDIFEKPLSNTKTVISKTDSCKPHTEKLHTENQRQLNTNILNTNNKILNKDVGTAKAVPTPPRKASLEACKLAELLHSLAVKNKPNRVIGKNWKEKWAKELDRLHRINKRSWEDIEKVIRWSQNQNGWWWDKIYSAEKIRAKIDDLESQMNREEKNPPKTKVYDFTIKKDKK